jgi:hypothetical protein
MRKTPIQQFFGKELSDIERILGKLRKVGAHPRVKVAPCEYALRYAVEDRRELFQAGAWYASHRTLFGDLESLGSLISKAGFIVKKTFSDSWSNIVIFDEKGEENVG